MMLKFLRRFAAAAVLPMLLSTAACADEFEAGKQYTVIAEEATPEPMVMEFYSFGCPHCFQFQSWMQSLEQSIGDTAEVQYIPVDFGNGYWTPTQELALVLSALGRYDELKSEAYAYIHVQRHFISSSDDAKEFMQQHGVSPEEYDRAAKSFAAHVKKSRYDQLTQRYRIAGTPTIIVNGKYRVELKELGGGPNEFVSLVRYLLTNP